MKKNHETLLHLAFWVVGFLLVFLIVSIASPEDEFLYNLGLIGGLLVVPSILSFYSQYLISFGLLMEKRNWSALFRYILLSSLVTIMISSSLIFFVIKFNWSCHQKADYFSFGIMFGVSILFSVIGLVVKGFFSWFRESRIKEELMSRNHDMEMKLIKSQLDPHFLFNSLNNVDALILKDSQKASTFLNKLSEIMRFMLYETKVKQIPLQKEIDYITKYIELQKIRTTNDLFVSFKVNGVTDNKSIAPMTLIPFVENAFKHATNKKIEEAIQIKVNISSTHVSFICTNRYEEVKSKEKNRGIGNELIQRRLGLLYGDKYQISLSNANGKYEINLNLPVW